MNVMPVCAIRFMHHTQLTGYASDASFVTDVCLQHPRE